MTSSQSTSSSATPHKSVTPNKKVVEEREVPLYQDPFHPVLLNSPSLHVTDEQDFFIKEVLETCCSDSAFAKKAYLALKFILSQEEVVPVVPVLTSLTPATALQAEAVTVVVAGTGFVDGAVVHVDGVASPAVFVSPTELNFSPDTATVLVQNITVVNPDLQVSNSLTFEVTAPVLLSVKADESSAYQKEVKAFEAKKKEEK